MADFEETRRTLAETRLAQSTAEGDLFRANEQLKQVTSQLEQLDRRFNPNNPEHVKQREELQRRRQVLLSARKERTAALGSINGRLAELSPVFWDQWTDPRQHADKMDDEIPVMLFPVRMETRFKTVSIETGNNISYGCGSTRTIVW